jgi:hypothetical protein
MNMKCVIGIGLLLGVLCWAAPSRAQEYVMHGRVSFDAGGGLIKGAEDADYSAASINTLVLPGDTLWADESSTMELEFSGGTYLRLADGSKAEVVALPPNGNVRAWIGSFYVHRLSRSTGDFVVETPAARIGVEADSNVRIDIVKAGGVTVTVRWGNATIFSGGESPGRVLGGQRVWIDPGMLPSDPVSFNRSEEDAFDKWNRERTEYFATGSTTPAAVQVAPASLGVSDLGNYGEWVYVERRYVWRPTVVVDYVPYRYGYWSFVPSCGYVWVDRYPFAYVTSHYGRWSYLPTYGWCWTYDPVWAPAWVATVRYGDYFLWTPVDFYSRPVTHFAYHSGNFSAHFTIGGVPWGFFATSCVPYTYIHQPRYYCDPWRYTTYSTYNPGGNVYIWNITINTQANPVRTPYRDPLQVRDYNPPRAIRGPQTTSDFTWTAGERVRSLETRNGRSSFAVDGASSTSGGGRTSASETSRAAQVRVARVTNDAPEFARASRNAPVSAEQIEARLRSRAEEAAVRGRLREDPSEARTARPAPDTGQRGGDDSVAGRRPGLDSRTPGGAATSRDENTPLPDRGSTGRTPRPDAAGRQVESPRSVTTAGPETGRTPRTLPRAATPDERGPAPAPERTQPPTLSNRGGTEGRAPRISTPPADGTAAPRIGGTGPREAQGPRVQTSVPRSESTPRIVTTSPRRTETAPVPTEQTRNGDMPRIAGTSPRTVEPRVQTSVPRTIETPRVTTVAPRSTETPRYDAPPSRGRESAQISGMAPRHVETPRIETPAPRRAETPRSVEVPQMRPAPMRGMDAPAPRPSPRIAPQEEAPRSFGDAGSPRFEPRPSYNSAGPAQAGGPVIRGGGAPRASSGSSGRAPR